MVSRPISRHSRVAAITLICVLGLLTHTGCQLAYFFTNPDKTKTVEPEYGNIGDRSVAVLVWADPTTLDEFPRATEMICSSVTYHMKQHLEDADFVSATKIADFKHDAGRDWDNKRHTEICEELDCDVLLCIDLQDFTSRASDTPQLRKARIDGTISLYECDKGEMVTPSYQDDVRITFPPETLHGSQDATESDLIHAAVEYFAMVTARKFYAHEVKLQDDAKKW